MRRARDFRASVYFLRTDEGGRQGPASSGYRPQFDFGFRGRNDEKLQNDGAITMEDRGQIAPGERATITVRLLHPETVADTLQPGLRFDVAEGPRVVARGVITQILTEMEESG